MGHPLADGDLIDHKYRIVRFIGRGAWASVYEGVNVRIGRRAAIKVLSEEAVQKGGIVDRFEREAQAATRIDSEHVVHVFDLGVLEDGRPYIVMELLEGESLGQRLQDKGQLSQARAVFYTIQALRGLGDAHAAGVMHRDIKPDNMVLVKTKHGEEILKIVDFGISKLQSGLQQVTSMTQTNTIMGSPVYMSPEQCRGTRHMDHRSDLYSLGVVLFEMLTGQLPHKGDTFNELMFKIALEDTESPQVFRPDLDDGLCAVVLKALVRDPNGRYQTAGEFEQALLTWGEEFGIDTGSWSSRRSRLNIADDSEIVTLTSNPKRASVPNPIELAETRPPGNHHPPSAGAIVRVETETRVDGSEGTASTSTKVSPQDGEPSKETTVPETTKSSTGGEATAQAVTGMDAAVPPRDAPKKRSMVWVAAAGLAVVGVVAFAVTRNSPAPATSSGGLVESPASAEPSATTSALATTEPPPETPDETAAAASASASAATSAEVSTAEPTATTTKPATPSFVPHRRTTTPTATGAAPSAAPTPSATAAPAASASSKSVVDGRRIRTDF